MIETGAELPAQTYRVTRADLVRYAGASGDFNAIHWSDRVAAKVGLPGVIAHGMFTMALAGRAVATWAGRPDAVVEFGVRFARPVVVPDDDEGTEVRVGAIVREVTGDGLARFDLTVTCHGEKVLAQARATVRLA
jgi:acyl dehydratase